MTDKAWMCGSYSRRKPHAGGTPISVNWRYHEENDTAMECGEEFKEETERITFNMVGFNDEDC